MAAMNAKTFNYQGQNYYYIHRHLAHFEKDAAVALFQQQKEENYEIMKNRFINNYLDNIIGINGQSLSMLDTAMRKEEIVGDLDKQLLNVLNERVSNAVQETNLNKQIKIAYSSLNNFINTQDAKYLDKLFAQITTATGLLTNNRKELMALIGRNKSNWKTNRDLSKLYMAMQQDFANAEGKMVTVNNGRLKSVETSLMKLVGDLSKGKFDKKTLTGYLRNIFSTQIGEYVVSKGIGKATNLAINEIKKSLSGARNIEVNEDPELQKLVNDYGQLGQTKFKTDNSFQNLSITVDSGDNININLGLSTKWYKGTNSGNVYNVAITNETKGSFVSRIEQMLGSGIERYYAYNALGLVQQDNSIYAALKAALVARNIDVLMSGLGVQGDFSQFLVINGNFYSIWQIVSAIKTFNEGQGSYGTGNKTDPVTISAVGLEEIGNLTEQAKNEPNNLVAAFVRARKQNEMIRGLNLSGHFYPNRLKNALK